VRRKSRVGVSTRRRRLFVRSTSARSSPTSPIRTGRPGESVVSRLPAVTISAIRGRARGAGSEFVLATDIVRQPRARRARSIRGRLRRGSGGAGISAPWSGRSGPDLEILLGERTSTASSRAIRVRQPRDSRQRVEDFRHPFRTPGLDVRPAGPGDIKHFVDAVSLPTDEGFPPQMEAFWKAVARPELQARVGRAFEGTACTALRRRAALGEYVGRLSTENR